MGRIGFLPYGLDCADGQAEPAALEAKEMAAFAYDMAKKAARLQRAKITATHRAQADALEIEAEAKRRLADEFDAAQQRGEVASARDGKLGRSGSERLKPTAADLGVSRKDIQEGRQVRDAEKTEPGNVERTLRGRPALPMGLSASVMAPTP